MYRIQLEQAQLIDFEDRLALCMVVSPDSKPGLAAAYSQAVFDAVPELAEFEVATRANWAIELDPHRRPYLMHLNVYFEPPAVSHLDIQIDVKDQDWRNMLLLVLEGHHDGKDVTLFMYPSMDEVNLALAAADKDDRALFSTYGLGIVTNLDPTPLQILADGGQR
jgi:hypothetical protein